MGEAMKIKIRFTLLPNQAWTITHADGKTSTHKNGDVVETDDLTYLEAVEAGVAVKES